MEQARRHPTTKHNARPVAKDAVALLKADHRQAEEWFEQFAKSRASEKRVDLANRLCAALRAHAMIEEEIFYPAFLEATGDRELHHEAEVVHAGAKHLIAQIEVLDAADEYFDSMVKVLAEMIKHHVREEEQPGGMFARARASEMDLMALGMQMQERKETIVAEARPPRPRAS